MVAGLGAGCAFLVNVFYPCTAVVEEFSDDFFVGMVENRELRSGVLGKEEEFGFDAVAGKDDLLGGGGIVVGFVFEGIGLCRIPEADFVSVVVAGVLERGVVFNGIELAELLPFGQSALVIRVFVFVGFFFLLEEFFGCFAGAGCFAGNPGNGLLAAVLKGGAEGFVDLPLFQLFTTQQFYAKQSGVVADGKVGFSSGGGTVLSFTAGKYSGRWKFALKSVVGFLAEFRDPFFGLIVLKGDTFSKRY